ncbi:MAG TPA: hypothetical protein VGH84_15310, partial [Steroidobacteraceae bacterium]
WPKDEVEKLKAWRSAGIGSTEVARRLGRTVASVAAKVRDMKLPALATKPTPPVRPRVHPPEVQRAGRTTLPPLPSLSRDG